LSVGFEFGVMLRGGCGVWGDWCILMYNSHNGKLYR